MCPLCSEIRNAFRASGVTFSFGRAPPFVPLCEKSLKAYTSSSRLLFSRYRTPLVARVGSSACAMAFVRS